MAARALLCAAVAVLLCAAAHSAVAPATGSNCVNNTIRYSNSDSVNGIKFVCFANSSWTGETPVGCMHQSVEHLPGTEWVYSHFVFRCYNSGVNSLIYNIVMCALPSNDSVHFAPGQTVGGFQCSQDNSTGKNVISLTPVAVVVANCTYGNFSHAPGVGSGIGGLFLVNNDTRTMNVPQIGVTFDCVANKASASGTDMNVWGCAVGSDPLHPILDVTIKLGATSVYKGDGKTYKCSVLDPAEPYVLGLKLVTAVCQSSNGNTYSMDQKWINSQTKEVFKCVLDGSNMTITAWGCVAPDGKQVQYGRSYKNATGAWHQCWNAAGNCTPVETTLKTKVCYAWRTMSAGGTAPYCSALDGTHWAIGDHHTENVTYSVCEYGATGAPYWWRRGICVYKDCYYTYIYDGSAQKCDANSKYPTQYADCYRSIPGDSSSMMWVVLLNEAQYVAKYKSEQSYSASGGQAGSGSGGNVATTTASSSATTSTANVSLQKCYSVPANQPTKDYVAAGQSCALAAFHAMSDYDKMVADSAGWSTPGARVWIDGRLQDCGPVDPTTAYMRGFLNGTAPECLAYDIAAKGLVFEQCAANMHYVCEAACAAG